MAGALLAGAAVGAVFGELLKGVLEIKDKAFMFKQTLIYLRSTLVAIAPVIKEIEQYNNDLGRSKEELESLIREMEEGIKLVYECSKIRRYNYLARVRYQKPLMALVDSLVKFFIIDMQAQTARDQKETLLKVRRILSAINKLPLVNREDTMASSYDSAPMPVDVCESEIHDSSAMETFELEIHALKHIPMLGTQQSEDAARTNSAEQSIVKARNNQGMKHLVSEKSYDQLRATENSLFSIPIPNIGGFNRQAFKKATCIKQNNKFYTEDDKTSYNEQVHPKGLVFLSSFYSFDVEDLLLRGSAELLGKGSYGTTYKSTLEDIATVVVKRLRDVKVSKTEFEQQMVILQTLLLEHPNVCPLRAYYCYDDKRLLIYDYIAGGSFSALMHERGRTGWTQLDWKSRMKILLGAARGIAHIHSVGGMNLVHGNIKSSNVLVTADFQGCISDFGLSRLLGLSVIPSGNKSYLAPEVIRTGKLTQKSDVYSFGVLLLEMMTGQTGKSPVEDPDLPSWVKIQAMDGLSYAFFDDAVKDDIRDGDMGVHMMTVAKDCASTVPYMRPSMNEVVKIMEDLITSN